MMAIALEIFPKDYELLACMARLEIALKHNHKLGREYINKAFANAPKESDWLYETKGVLWFDCLDEKEEGLACLEKAVGLNRSDTNLINLAFRILEDDIERAQALFKEVLATNPNDEDALYGLAEICFRKSQDPEGLELTKKAYALAPSHPGINALLGSASFGMGKLAEALRFYVDAEKVGFDDKEYLYKSIADCYSKIGKVDEAQKYAEKAKRLSTY